MRFAGMMVLLIGVLIASYSFVHAPTCRDYGREGGRGSESGN
jgi:hypothetical protein